MGLLILLKPQGATRLKPLPEKSSCPLTYTGSSGEQALSKGICQPVKINEGKYVPWIGWVLE